MIIFKSANERRRAKLMEKERKEMLLVDIKTTIGIFEEFYDRSLIPEADKVHAKTLVIGCDKDEIAPLDQVKTLAKRIPHSKLVVMKNSGHLVVLERPLATATIARKWLEKEKENQTSRL